MTTTATIVITGTGRDIGGIDLGDLASRPEFQTPAVQDFLAANGYDDSNPDVCAYVLTDADDWTDVPARAHRLDIELGDETAARVAPTTSLRDLAEQIATEQDTDPTATLAAVEVYAQQISDDPDLYDPATGEVTEAGAQVITASFRAAQALPATDAVLSELIDAAEDASTARQADRESRRDDLVRAALRDGVPVREIVAATNLSRARVYQIRDHRR